MAIKVTNNTVNFNKLVPTFLIYKAYLKINNLDPFTPSIIEQAAVI